MRALPDNAGSAGLLLLTPVEDQAVVHLTFFVECALLHFDLAHALLLDLEGLCGG